MRYTGRKAKELPMKRSDAQGALARAEDARLLSEQLVQSLA